MNRKVSILACFHYWNILCCICEGTRGPPFGPTCSCCVLPRGNFSFFDMVVLVLDLGDQFEAARG